MTPSQELSRFADRIESGELRWRPRFPEQNGDCCAAFWIEPDQEPQQDVPGTEPRYATDSLTDEAGERLIDAIDWMDFDADPTYVPSVFELIGDWNDRPTERTKQEVVAALRKASVHRSPSDGESSAT